jgi:monoamine oxidase
MKLRLSRRKILGAAIALPFVARAQSFDTDIVIVGAGAAGLGAAQACRATQKRHIILEAQNRIGGRVLTDRSLGEPYDAGAFYIHWAERNPWTRIAADLNIEVMDDGLLPRGSWLRFEKGQRAPSTTRLRYFGEISRRFDADQAQVPDVSFTDHVADNLDLLPGVRAMARMSLGEEPEQISARDYAGLWSGDDYVVPQGYGTLLERFATDMPVHLSTPVRMIRWDGAGVEVTSDAGMIRARAAIITVPVNVLAKGVITFLPHLPARIEEGLHGLGMGALSKIALRFSGSRFGLSQGTHLFDDWGDGAGLAFEFWPFDRDLVVATLGGDFARGFLARSEREVIVSVVERLGLLLGDEIARHFVAGRVHAWANDPWALGCYSHARPGQVAARAKLAEPVADRLYFAGEATAMQAGSFGPAMTVGGATLAGQAAALSVRL